MRQWLILPAGAAAAACLTLASCEVDDDPLPVISNSAPSVTVIDVDGETITDASVADAAIVRVLGNDSLVTVTVNFEDPNGNMVNYIVSSPDTGQIIEDGNPLPASADRPVPDATSFSGTYTLLAPGEEEGSRQFDFIATDDGTLALQNVETSTASIVLRRFTELGEGSDTITFVLDTTGMASGFDLSSGQAVDATDSTANLLLQPDTLFAQPAFVPAEGTLIRSLGEDDSLGVATYDTLAFEQDLTDLYDRGVGVSGNTAAGLMAGDIYLVNSGMNFYIMRIAGIDSVAMRPSAIRFNYRTAVIEDED